MQPHAPATASAAACRATEERTVVLAGGAGVDGLPRPGQRGDLLL